MLPRLALRSSLSFALTVLSGLAGAVLIVLQADHISRIIAGVFLSGLDLPAVSPLLRTLLVIVLLRALAAFLGEVAAHHIAARVKSELRMALLNRLVGLGPGFLNRQRTGETVALLQDGIESLDAYFSQFLPQVALAALIPLTILFSVFQHDSLSGIILLLTAPLIPIFMVLVGKMGEIATRKRWTALSRLSAHFLDAYQGLTTLKQFNRSRDQAKALEETGERYRQATLEVLRVTFLSALALELIATLSTAVLAVEIGLRLLVDRIPYQQALMILILAPEFYLPLRNLGLRFHAGMAGVTAGKKILEILDYSEPSRSPEGLPAVLPAAIRGEPSLQPPRLVFSHVTYSYPGADLPAVEDISFVLEPGQRLALVGPSGAGKSTLAHLLLRLVEPTSGEILLDGVPHRSIPAEVWRQTIAWVPQQPYIFHDTIAANLRLADPAAPLEQVRAAARLAHLDDWVQTLPDRYETIVGDRGARLSSGQAQRLALARAFLKGSSLLVLDEPTAHLDPELEAQLEESTCRIVCGRTVLTIAHRLETVRSADIVLVIEDGKIVQAGSHARLSSRPGLYSRLISAAGGV